MTVDELRYARHKLRLSTAALARVLRLGTGGARTVRRWEAGESRIPGPAQVAIELLLAKQQEPHEMPPGTSPPRLS